jgi:hypothetical protein
MDFTPLGVLYHFKRQLLGQSPVSASPMSIDQLNRLEFAWDKYFRDGSDTAMNLYTHSARGSSHRSGYHVFGRARLLT